MSSGNEQVAPNPQTQEETHQAFTTTGMQFVKAFGDLRTAIMAISGKPTAAGFQQVRDIAKGLAFQADTLAGLCNLAEKGGKVDDQTQLPGASLKFAPRPIDPTVPLS